MEAAFQAEAFFNACRPPFRELSKLKINKRLRKGLSKVLTELRYVGKEEQRL